MLTGLFLFPALIWLISAPMVSAVETEIRVFLLTKVTIVVFNIFDIIGYEIEREGNVLLLPEGQVGVEEACSGIRSLTACLFAGSFLAAVFLNRFWKKVLLVAAAMGLGTVALYTESIWCGCLIHVTVALTMDGLAMAHTVGFPGNPRWIFRRLQGGG